MPKEVVKKYKLESGRVVELRPLSWLDMLEFPDTFLEVLPKKRLKREDIIKSFRGILPDIFEKIFDISRDDMKSMEPAQGLEMYADFLEMNLSENFLSALDMAIQGTQSILSRLSSFSKREGTQQLILENTQ